MHQCLRIGEIVHHIFSFVDDDRTLCSLARTSHDFNEPATDLLWRTFHGIESLYPLLSCVGYVYDYATYKSIKSIIRPLNDEDWNVIERFTRKARSLYISAGGPQVSERDPKAVQFLANPPSPDSFFPNLQVLSINLEGASSYSQATDTVIAFVQLLSRHYISHLYLNFAGLRPTHFKWAPYSPSGMNFAVLLPTYPKNPCSPSRSLFEAPGLNITQRTSILPWLDSIQFGSCEVSYWAELEYCPEIWNGVEKLDVCTYTQEQGPLSRRLPPKLNTLTLEKAAPTALKVVSQCMCPNQLTSLSICMPHDLWGGESGLQELKELLALISLQYPLLESLLLQILVPPTTSALAIQQSTIEPCLRLKSLRVLAIETHYQIDLSDCSIKKMGQAWPHLECLYLRSLNAETVPTRLTLSGVAALIDCCPKLRMLSLAIDASSPTVPSGLCPRRADGTIIQGSNVWLADFCDSYISSPVSVAKYLSDLLPHLTHLGVPPRPWARAEAWREVAKKHQNQPSVELCGLTARWCSLRR